MIIGGSKDGIRSFSWNDAASGVKGVAGTPLGHGAAWMAGLMLTGPALAQDAGPNAITLDTIDVVGTASEGQPANTLEAESSVSRLPGTIQDTPQVVNVINEQIMLEQNTTTLDQVLRNVPGVTISSGEGNGGMNGDQFRIRGFDAKNDIYYDGLRDIGVYTHDSFAYEQVQVFMGPSSESFGYGTTGGAINIQTKAAHLGDKNSADATLGMGPLFRATADVNKQINDTTAFRIVAMGQKQDIVDRDHLFADRWGVLSDFGFGLGTDHEWHLSYLHQHNKNKPDQGVPTVFKPSKNYRMPVTEFGVDRDTYYGQRPDIDRADVDMLTSRYKGKINDWLRVTNDTRLEFFNRQYIPTTVSCSNDCSNEFWATGDATYGFTAGGGSAYKQNSWGIQNITTAIAEFNTSFLKHQLVAGVDVNYVDEHRISYGRTEAKLPGAIRHPRYEPNYDLYLNRGNQKKAWATDIGLFASDRIWFNDQWSVIGGIRWDSYDVKYRTSSNYVWTSYHDKPDWFSPKASLVWEPTKDQTYYFSYATSANPPGTNPANASNPLARDKTSVEENETFELGAKISLLEGRLGLTGAIFRINKNNAHYEDANGDTIFTGQKQRVDGIQIGVSGNITEEWEVLASYAYLDSKITADPANPANKGNPVPNVAPNNFSIWSTYDIATLVGVDGKLKIGGGIIYADPMWLRADKGVKVPEYFSLDAMVSYEINGYRFAINGYNLTDELNYTAGFGGSAGASSRAVVAPGRTIMATVGVDF